jgi:CO dehydrogenase/acetyl-CoA synthase epsilon subunit
MLWDLIQQFQLGEARDRASTMEERVAFLERKVERNDRVLVEVIKYLEQRDNRDLDGDGSIG